MGNIMTRKFFSCTALLLSLILIIGALTSCGGNTIIKIDDSCVQTDIDTILKNLERIASQGLAKQAAEKKTG